MILMTENSVKKREKWKDLFDFYQVLIDIFSYWLSENSNLGT